MPPPRLYPNGREENSSSGSNGNENIFACSSPCAASQSPSVMPLTVLSKNTPSVYAPEERFDRSSSSRCEAMLSPPIQSRDRVFLGKLSMPDFPLLGLGDVKMPKTSTDGILQLTPRKKLNFSRESEEEKMVALTQGPFRETDIFRPPSSEPNEKFDTYRHIRLTRSGEVSHHSKPMPSITLNLQKGWHSTHSRSPRYLPRPVPIVQNKSRSLFDISTDPLEGILRADAIAEAGRIYEPLTDEDDSDIDKDDDYFLCLPQAKEENDVHSKSLMKVLKQKFSPRSSADNTDASNLQSSKFPRTKASCASYDRKSADLLSSSCEQVIIQDKSSGFKLPLSSELSELSADMFKPLQPSELRRFTAGDSPDEDVVCSRS
jgi:hypothetical protein